MQQKTASHKCGGNKALEEDGEPSEMQDIEPMPADRYSVDLDLLSLANEGDDDIL